MNKINKENIEAYLLDLAEGTINEEDKKEVLAFLEQNTEYKEMFALYDDQLVLQEDSSIAFEDKQLLKHRVIFPYWKRVIYVASSVAAIVLLFYLLKPGTDVITDTTNSANPIANTIKPTNKVEKISDTSTYTASSYNKPTNKNNNSKSSLETTVAQTEEQPTYYANDITEDTNPATYNDSQSQDLIVQNTTYVSNHAKNDTVYVIYVGGKQNRTNKLAHFVEKHTNIDILPAVSFIKQTAGKVKETKDKYLKI